MKTETSNLGLEARAIFRTRGSRNCGGGGGRSAVRSTREAAIGHSTTNICAALLHPMLQHLVPRVVAFDAAQREEFEMSFLGHRGG